MTWLRTPAREWRRFKRALDFTTRATCDAEAFLCLMDRDWGGERTTGHLAEETVDPEELVRGVAVTNDETPLVIIDSTGEIGELPPDMPQNPLQIGDGYVGRRAAAFRRYWVARAQNEYPRVVGCWDEGALACTRLFLCKAMRAARKYYVEDVNEQGRVVLRAQYKQGMTESQIAHCVDWLVTAVHTGTPRQAIQRAVHAQMKPNWLMRMCGLTGVSYHQ